MKDSELLKEVRHALSKDTTYSVFIGICRLIDDIGDDLSQNSSLRRWITSMIGERFLDDWLYTQGHMSESEYKQLNLGNQGNHIKRLELCKKLSNTRLAWLDWMIAECEKAEAIK